MTHNYTVDLASYSPTGPSPNSDPFVWVHGTVDGTSTPWIPVYWSTIQQAFAVGGTAGVQALLAPILLGSITGPPFPPVPRITTPVAIPAPMTVGGGGSPNGAAVSVPQALVTSWVA